jgi:molecular chaperone GrpE
MKSTDKKTQEPKESQKTVVDEAAATYEPSEEAKQRASEAAEQSLNEEFGAEAEAQAQEQPFQVESLEEIQAELAEAKEQLIRTLADNQNIRRRAEADRYRYFEESKVKYVGLFLPVFDDLMRSIDMSEKFEVPEGFMEGIRMVGKKFEEIFEKEQVERIDQSMVPFDVEIHEAMMRQPAPEEGIEPDTVLQVFEPGYRMGGRVIKHAKVIVSQ